MCQACEHNTRLIQPNLSLAQIQLNMNRYDPTRTTTLRKGFVSASNKRFKRLKRLIQQKVQEQDFFGLKVPLNNNSAQQNIESFLQWLEQAERNTILDKRWVEDYIRLAYERGIERARTELRKMGVDTTQVDEELRRVLGQPSLSTLPYHVDQVGALYARVFTELSGITTEMNTQITRILSEGLLQGDSPVRLARKINSAIIETKADLGLKISYTTKTGKTVSYFMSGRRRAEIMARTEIIRAHHVATIEEYKRWGVHGVKVKAEFMTARDGRVCPTCSGLEGSVWSLDDALTLIPVHPQCRCFALPYIVQTDIINK